MAIYTPLTHLQIQKLLEHFPKLPRASFQSRGIALGTVNTYYRIEFKNHRAYYLKIDEVADLKRLRHEIRVFDFLDRRRRQLRIDVPVPLRAKNKKKFIPFLKKFALLVPEIKGISYYNSELTPLRMQTLGKTLACWHKVCAKTALPRHRFNLDGQKKVFREIQKKLKKKHPALEKFIAKKLVYLQKNQPKREKKTLIHADLFAENILWIGNKLNGIVDFDAAGTGSVFFDLGVVLHALCHDGKKFNPLKIRSFWKGYWRNTPLTSQQIISFRYNLELSAMRFLLTRLRDFELNPKGDQVEPFKDFGEFVRRFDEIDQVLSCLKLLKVRF